VSGGAILADPVLVAFRAEIREFYGNRLSRAILFGSRARGDARPDSDYDIALFLDPLPDRWAEIFRLADVGTRYLLDTGRAIEAWPFALSRYDDLTPLMHEIRRDGVDL